MQISRTLGDPALPPRSTCVALGLFDGLHLGHRAVLESTVKLAETLGAQPLCFTFSTGRHTPAAKEGMTRLMSGTLMKALLADMGFAHMVWPDFDEFRGLSPLEFVRDVLAHRMGAAGVVCGFDFHFGKNAAGNPRVLTQLCGELGLAARILPAVEQDGGPVASRRIRALIRQGDIPGANRLLGRSFAIDFEVIHGRRLGRTLGSPTINQPFPDDFTLPRFGVYATLARVGEIRYPSVTNVGLKPTVGSERVLAETYIHGFEGDLYNRRIMVEFLRFLRPEEKFPDLDALRAQIGADAAAATRIAKAHLAGIEP